MITNEKIYSVFGITPGPWIQGGCTGRMIQPKDEEGSDYWLADVDIKTNSFLIKSSPEMLVVLVNIVYENDLAFENNTLGRKLFNGANKQAIKAIESADSQNRKWPELLKALEE